MFLYQRFPIFAEIGGTPTPLWGIFFADFFCGLRILVFERLPKRVVQKMSREMGLLFMDDLPNRCSKRVDKFLL